jgi:hypothetical protein
MDSIIDMTAKLSPIADGPMPETIPEDEHWW